jgi:hypothetical protein
LVRADCGRRRGKPLRLAARPLGLSRHLLPRYLAEAIRKGGPSAARVIQAMMGMVKTDIEELKAAAGG